MCMINYERVREVARSLSRLRSKIQAKVDMFEDPNYYPSRGIDNNILVTYFLVMVAMDHRLSRPGRPYEAVLEGRKYHGADLLYRLGKKMLDSNASFFEPHNLEQVTEHDIMKWLCIGKVCPPDPRIRAMLLRDLGYKLRVLYNNEPLKLISESKHLLHSWYGANLGFVEHLKNFYAFNDPVEKKAMLLAKFLERRGVLKIKDSENKRVPVDNHLARIGLRLQLIYIDRNIYDKILRRVEVSPWEDICIRITLREAWHKIAVESGLDDFVLDDLLWSMGRRTCIQQFPRCNDCSSGLECENGSCIFHSICPVGLGEAPPIDEHLYTDTWWY